MDPSPPNVAELQRMGLRCMFDKLIEAHSVIRHDSKRLARLLLEEFVQKRPAASAPLTEAPALALRDRN
jgi:hypothetical protein